MWWKGLIKASVKILALNSLNLNAENCDQSNSPTLYINVLVFFIKYLTIIDPDSIIFICAIIRTAVVLSDQSTIFFKVSWIQ